MKFGHEARGEYNESHAPMVADRDTRGCSILLATAASGPGRRG
jgi:hypothetical protein